MRFTLSVSAVLATASVASAALHTETVKYRHGDVELEGYLAYDEQQIGKRPGVLVIHEWWGHNAYARQRAEMVARLGYVAFALDMYGKGVQAKDPQDAAKKASVFKKDRALMRARAAAGLAILAANPRVDAKRLAAMGYCFGGTTSLELARSGADLSGTVCFHGNLATPNPEDAANIKGKVLVLHGADDPVVPPAEVAAFEDEMRDAKVDWQLVTYGGAVHGFTNRMAGSNPKRGMAYNARADTRSWEAMKTFFAEIFGKK
jgi:dienelactone hydrolase